MPELPAAAPRLSRDSTCQVLPSPCRIAGYGSRRRPGASLATSSRRRSIPMRSKKATQVKARTLPPKKRIGLTSALGPKATTMVVIAVMAGGIFIGARQQLKAKAAHDAEAAQEMSASAAPAASDSSAARGAMARAKAPATPDTSAAPKAPVMTIAGGLERSGDAVRLKDTTGDDAPKSRKWKP